MKSKNRLFERQSTTDNLNLTNSINLKKVVRESLNESLEEFEENDDTEISAGLVIIQDNNILLAHPKGAKWWGSYSIPKGKVEKGEEPLEAAIRETFEEVGIYISEEDITSDVVQYIDYEDKNGNVYKRVYFFIAEPEEKIENTDIHVDKKEVDWAGFLSKEKASQRILPKLKPILDLLPDEEDEDDEDLEDMELDLGIE